MKKSEYNMENNSGAEWKARRQAILSCSYCKPNKGENRKRNCTHNTPDWKRKSKSPHQYKKIKVL